MPDKSRVNRIIKRYEQLESNRSVFMRHWQDLARVMLPVRTGFTETFIEGEELNEDLLDGTAAQAARSLANTVGAMIRPEGEVLATIVAEDDRLNEVDEAVAWMGDATRRFNSALRNPLSRFRQATSEVDLDLTVFGTGMLFSGLSASQDHLLFQSIHLKHGVPFFDDEGRVVGMFRFKIWTVWQLEERFGKENLSTEIKQKLSNGRLDDKVKVLHVVQKRNNVRFEDPLLAKNMPFESLWIDMDDKHIMEEGGFHEFPFIVPRWDTSSGEDFGRSPGMVALPDANTTQAMEETMLIAGQRVADPPLAVPNDGSFSAVNTFPGGLVYYDFETASALGGNPFFPIQSGANLPVTRDMLLDKRQQIMSAFFKNILNLPVGGPQMTATEVIQRKDEFIREVGAVFGRFETDYNQPLASRAFNVMLRAGGFDEIPEVLQGENIKFEFELPITKIRKQVEAAAARMWALETLELSQARPEAADMVNVDELVRFSAKAAGIPHEIVNGREVVEKIRQARTEAQQEANQMAQIAEGADIAETVAKASDKLGIANQPQEAEGA